VQGDRSLRSWIFDVALAVAVAAIALAGSIAEAHPTVHGNAHQLHEIRAHQPGAAYALVVLSGLALIWRRRWPLVVLAVTVCLTAAYSAAGYVPGAALVTCYIAIYTVATRERRGVAIGATAVSALLLFVTAGLGVPFGWLGGTNAVMVVCCIAAVAIGLAVAERRQVFAAAVERAEWAERDREEEARRRVDAERLRIARELHDVVAHSMSMINIQAGVAAHVLTDQPEQAAAALSAIKSASREGLRELRAILNVLRQVDADEPEREPAPGLSQLPALVHVTSQAGLPTQLSMANGAVLPASVELAVYRIVQESLTNAVRHAGPGARAQVRVETHDGLLHVQVDDEGGAGAVASGEPGSGIAGMRERVAALGGTFRAGPKANGGWRVESDIPVGEGTT
jgi:signal transduction histidine kinase